MNKQTLYLDYSGDGLWILSETPDFKYPRVNVCADPTRLFQEYFQRFNLVISDAAVLLFDHELMSLSWRKQYFKYEKYRTEEIQPD